MQIANAGADCTKLCLNLKKSEQRVSKKKKKSKRMVLKKKRIFRPSNAWFCEMSNGELLEHTHVGEIITR